MLDPATASGLASAIICFTTLTYQVTKKAVEFSALHGELPSDLQSCKELLDITLRACKRLTRHISPDFNGEAAAGPLSESDSDLTLLIERCRLSAQSLLTLLEDIQASNFVGKALKVVRKEGRIKNIRIELDRNTFAILQILSERDLTWAEETAAIAKDLRRDLLLFHNDLGSQMKHGLQRLATGQEDLNQTVTRMSENFSTALENNDSRLADWMQTSLNEHQVATQALQAMASREIDRSLGLQLRHLSSELTRTCKIFENASENSNSCLSGKNIYHHHVRFEFRFHSEVIGIHIERCTDWVSSSFFSLKTNWIIPRSLSIPIPHLEPTVQSHNLQTETLSVMIPKSEREYRMVDINLKDTRNNHDIYNAVHGAFARHEKRWRSIFRKREMRVKYVKVSATVLLWRYTRRVPNWKKPQQYQNSPTMNFVLSPYQWREGFFSRMSLDSNWSQYEPISSGPNGLFKIQSTWTNPAQFRVFKYLNLESWSSASSTSIPHFDENTDHAKQEEAELGLIWDERDIPKGPSEGFAIILKELYYPSPLFVAFTVNMLFSLSPRERSGETIRYNFIIKPVPHHCISFFDYQTCYTGIERTHFPSGNGFNFVTYCIESEIRWLITLLLYLPFSKAFRIRLALSAAVISAQLLFEAVDQYLLWRPVPHLVWKRIPLPFTTNHESEKVNPQFEEPAHDDVFGSATESTDTNTPYPERNIAEFGTTTQRSPTNDPNSTTSKIETSNEVQQGSDSEIFHRRRDSSVVL